MLERTHHTVGICRHVGIDLQYHSRVSSDVADLQSQTSDAAKTLVKTMTDIGQSVDLREVGSELGLN